MHSEPRSEQDWTRLVRKITRKTEAWMDEGFGECVFRNPQIAAEMSKSLLHFQNDRHFMSCFAVMPNHIHLVTKPLGEYALEQILESIKGFVSRRVNAILGRKGPLWEEESYDRIIRNDEQLFRVLQYIGRNPAKSGLPYAQWVRWLNPDWAAAGWAFRDEI